ncbi:MAG TPA: DNA repair protein RecN [Saprospiraceae bacterium]|nr:DNA repair protein RecN [Saprospiraceae bacterium]
MLTRLLISNYAIITEMDLSFQPGLTVITGETGAGKSILLGALGLALGRRADTRVMSDANKKCIVEAHFSTTHSELKDLFEQEELDYEDTIIFRREISSSGKSRSFINDTPVQVKSLQDISGRLIELHQQHDNLALQSKDYQIHSLDVISESVPEFNQYRSLYKRLVQEKQQLAKVRELELSSARRKDFLLFQIKELETAQLKSGEIEKLEESQNILQHAEAIHNTLQQLQSVLNYGSHSVSAQLIQLSKQLDTVRHISPALTQIAERIDAFKVEVQDLALESGRKEDIGASDISQLPKIESRLSQIYTLIKKYQVKDEAGLLDLLHSMNQELNDLAFAGEQIELLENKISETSKELKNYATILSLKRKQGASKIIPQMNSLLIELGMVNAKFSIDLKQIDEPGPDGMDDVAFLFSANKGMQLHPLQNVASGGELSRLSLALKSLYAAQAELPTIIFDEIDTGISGEVAWRMGQLIRGLAKGHQVLMITHSPQIAAHAGIQFHVSKVLTDGKDTSSVKVLTKDLRLIEIAKMLSGDPPSKEALANAKSLVNAIKN